MSLFEEMAETEGITKASLALYLTRAGADPSQITALQSAFLVLCIQHLFLNTYPISVYQFLAVLTVFEYVWNGSLPQKNNYQYNLCSFCLNDCDLLEKLRQQLSQLRQVYLLVIVRDSGLMRSARLQQICANYGEKVDFWSFLTAIPLIMAKGY